MRNSHRIVLYAKDLVILTGRSLRHCQKLISKMKIHFGKSKDQQVTKEEAAEFLGLPKKTIEDINLD